MRRIGRWLAQMRSGTVSREEIRREALCQTVDAEGADSIIERLARFGALRPPTPHGSAAGGRRKRRWEVNPDLWTG